MSVRARAILCLAIASSASYAHAQSDNVCLDREIAPAPSTGYPLAPARRHEIWAAGGLMGDWVIDRAAMSPRIALDAEWIPLLDIEQRWRLGFLAGISYGAARDDIDELPLRFGLGVTGRGSFVMDDFFDGFFVFRARPELAIADEYFSVLRLGLGPGVRVLRAAQLEATFDYLHAFGQRFPDGDRNGFGISITLGYDFCTFECQPKQPPPSKRRDLSCELYERARAVCDSQTERAQLCAFVAEAIGVAEDRDNQAADSIAAFLGALAKSAKGSPSEAATQALAQRHEQLLEWLLEWKRAEREAAKQGKRQSIHCSYAPVALLIRDKLGCDVAGKPAACGDLATECPPEPD